MLTSPTFQPNGSIRRGVSVTWPVATDGAAKRTAGTPRIGSRAAVGTADRIAVGLRILAATLGNYAVTSLAIALLARLLPMQRAEATMTATLASFAIFAVIAMASFGVRSIGRCWAWLAGSGALLTLALWLSLVMAGRV
ncbi:hypothetical protein [uncultured Sphingomonas sp.]|uniref:hypothetical protein n=1 Tax=uncultured Sphingomonas sp. TaxID=158754 RepID=UPI0025DB92B0|nr:hypothetical protein [uncultured Sphingomonas sp.]